MSDKLIFWVIVVGLLLFLEACLYFGLKKKSCRKETASLNRQVYQDELSSLNKALRAKHISESEYKNAVRELEIRVIEESDVPEVVYKDRAWTSYVSLTLCFLFPALALWMYFSWANPSLINYSHSVNQESVPAKRPDTALLKAFLKESPNDARGWIFLADDYARSGRFKDAADALGKAFEASPQGVAKTPVYVIQRAVYLLETGDPILRSRASEEVDRAIRLDPTNGEALQLGARLAYLSGNFTKAVKYWDELLPSLTPGTREYSLILDAISDASNRAQMMNFR